MSHQIKQVFSVCTVYRCLRRYLLIHLYSPDRLPTGELWRKYETLISDEFSPCTGCLAGCSQCRDCIHCIDHPEDEGCDKCRHCEPCVGCAACVSGDCPAYGKCTDCTLCMPCLKDRNLPGCDKVSSCWPAQTLAKYFSVQNVPLVQKLLDVSTIQPPTQNMYSAWMLSLNWTTVFKCLRNKWVIIR